jgi:galactitol-specific phosphotransferase system IIB component
MSIIDIAPILYPPVRINSGSPVTLDAAEEFLVQVLRVPESGTLNKIGWRTGSITAGTSYVLKISIETVAETVGQPVATSNATKTLYAASAESADITSLTANTVYYTPINGSSGISVTAGDNIAVTFRLLSVTGSVINVFGMLYGLGGDMLSVFMSGCYCATYLGSSWSDSSSGVFISLEYSDGFAPIYMGYPATVQSTLVYNSGSSNKYRGVKFKYPFGCRLSGMNININTGADWQIILFDSDEYTVVTGFPITVKALQRGTTGYRDIFVQFPVKATINANAWYRLIVLPTTTTDIYTAYNTPVDDGSFSGADCFFGGANFIHTYRSTAPSSGDHAWTDSNLKMHMCLFLDGIEASTGAAGGISRSRQLMG